MSTSVAQVPIQRTDVHTHDRDEANQLIEQMYVGHRPHTGPHRPNTELSVRSASAEELTADRVRMTITLDTGTDAFGTLLSFQLLDGSIRVNDGTEEVHADRGDALLYRPGMSLRVQSDGFEVAMLRLPAEWAATVAEQHAGIDPAELRFESMRPVTAAMGRYFNSVIALVHRELLAPGSATSNPLVTEQMTRTAAAAMLTTFPNTTMTVDHLPEPGWAPPAALRRAEAYIDTHAAQPLTLSDIATAAGVTGRALQQAFRRHHDTTPTGYLRQVRLQRAHQELTATDPASGSSVTAIAARWGFTKPSTFAATYHRHYGVRPAHVLHT